jgi:hypothetical protein
MAEGNEGAPALETLQAQLAAMKGDLEGAKARATELANEVRGHRLNADKHRAEAEKAAKERDDAIADVARKAAESEAAHAAKVKAAETKAAEAAAGAQQKAIRADLKVAAKDAGARSVADVLALLDLGKVKLDDSGEVANAAELIAEMKKAKPYLFGQASTSSTETPPPPAGTGAGKPAKDMTDAEFDEALRRRAWRK